MLKNAGVGHSRGFEAERIGSFLVRIGAMQPGN